MTNEGVRLGDLLTGAGLISPEDLREAIAVARNQSLPVGRVLIMSGYISEQHLQAAVQAQSILKDGLVDLGLVFRALTLVAEEGINLEPALDKLGWRRKGNAPTNKIGELLIEAGIVTPPQLDSALAQSASSGLPLGRVLVVTGVVKEQVLASALNAQILVRDGKVSRSIAIQGLKASRERHVSLEQSLAETGSVQLPTFETVRLGELLVMAGLLDPIKLMQSVEIGLVTERPIGQVLIEAGSINQSILTAALQVQKMIGEGKLNKQDAVAAIAAVAQKGITADQALQELSPAAPGVSRELLPLYQFLQLAGVVTAQDIEKAVRAGSRDSELMGRMLLLADVIDQNLLISARQCNELLNQGILKTEQAIIAMGICVKSNKSLDDAFAELNWNISGLTLTEGKNPPSLKPSAALKESNPSITSAWDSDDGSPAQDTDKPKKRFADLIP